MTEQLYLIHEFAFPFVVHVKAMEVKKTMSAELQALKQELQQKGSHDRQHDKELISAMKEQVILVLHYSSS